LGKRNRLQVQGSTFWVKDNEGIKDQKSSLKMLIFPNNCQFGSKFWMKPNEADVFLLNTHPKCSPGTRMQPLTQTWHFKVWWWKAKPVECESNFIATSRRTLRGVGYPPAWKPYGLEAEPEARAGLNP
jgi:hypothetical protein